MSLFDIVPLHSKMHLYRKKLCGCPWRHVCAACLFWHPTRITFTVTHHAQWLVQIHIWCPHARLIRRSSMIKASALWVCSSVTDIDMMTRWAFFLVTLVLSSLKRSTHSYTFHWFMVGAPYCVNTRRWISAGLTPSCIKNGYYGALFFDGANGVERSIHTSDIVALR